MYLRFVSINEWNGLVKIELRVLIPFVSNECSSKNFQNVVQKLYKSGHKEILYSLYSMEHIFLNECRKKPPLATIMLLKENA